MHIIWIRIPHWQQIGPYISIMLPLLLMPFLGPCYWSSAAATASFKASCCLISTSLAAVVSTASCVAWACEAAEASYNSHNPSGIIARDISNQYNTQYSALFNTSTVQYPIFMNINDICIWIGTPNNCLRLNRWPPAFFFLWKMICVFEERVLVNRSHVHGCGRSYFFHEKHLSFW